MISADLTTSVRSEDLVKFVKKYGYFKVSGFFPRERIQSVRTELLVLLDRDLERRSALAEETKPPVKRMDEDLYLTTFTRVMHTRFFPSFECNAFADLIGDMLEDPRLAGLIDEILGKDYKLRSDLIRRSSGINDSVDIVQLPHEWHRDTLAEFTFGVFFDDVTTPNSGGTSVIPGTHTSVLDPRWDLMLAEKARPDYERFLSGNHWIDPNLYKLTKMNRRARWELARRRKELLGEMGDIYFFFNQTWHGRAPNTSNQALAIARVGGHAAGHPASAVETPKGGPLNPTLKHHYTPPPERGSPLSDEEPYLVTFSNHRDSEPLFTRAAKEKRRLISTAEQLHNAIT